MNTLTDEFFPLLTTTGQYVRASFSALLSFYAKDTVSDLPFLRPHQHAPWHSFMVLLAALALHRGGIDQIPDDPDTWRDLLRALTARWPDDEPWRLVVGDVTKPAFMQPPVPAGMADPHKTPIATPDDLDVLVTAKNHGVKQGLVGEATPAAWVAALVMLQTTGGFLGAGNYGIARMNGGFATRPFTGLVPRGGIGAHWRRDVEVMLGRRGWFFERIDFAENEGAALLWCLPWDGERSLELGQLDPWFIEVCRRMRLYPAGDGGIVAKSVGSKAARISAKELLGNVGDPWIPLNLDKGSAAYNRAPSYRAVSEVLFEREKWLRPLLLEWQDGIDALPMWARFDVTVRGQGTTEGHHLREVPVETERRRAFLFDTGERDKVAELARQMLVDAGDLQNKVMKAPLLTLVQAGDAEVDFGDRTATRWVQQWLNAADRQIDEQFFEQLFRRAEAETWESWGRFLRSVAHETFDAAARTVPIAGARRLKALAVAEQKLGALFWKRFNGYLPEKVEETADVG